MTETAQRGEASYLLEYLHNSVTNPGNEHGAYFEVSKCRCQSWFCPDCCQVMGYNLRAKLIPVLRTFDGLIMVTLTVDPLLFHDPKTAYIYIQDRRCLSRTTQDLDRGGYVFTRRYFYVVEWQKDTEQAHFHVLLDSQFIPVHALNASWSKHRPHTAGPVLANRPDFGFCFCSVPNFEGGFEHAARYATKYLIKAPEHGFPNWVLDMGSDRRIRRFSASRGLWGHPTKQYVKDPDLKPIPRPKRSYHQKLEICGQGVNIIEVTEIINPQTGEIAPKRSWVGRLNVPANEVIPKLFDPGNPNRSRRSLLATSPTHAKQIIEKAANKPTDWVQRRNPARYSKR